MEIASTWLYISTTHQSCDKRVMLNNRKRQKIYMLRWFSPCVRCIVKTLQVNKLLIVSGLLSFHLKRSSRNSRGDCKQTISGYNSFTIMYATWLVFMRNLFTVHISRPYLLFALERCSPRKFIQMSEQYIHLFISFNNSRRKRETM